MPLLDVIVKGGQQLCHSLLRTSIFGEQEFLTAQRADVAHGLAPDPRGDDEVGSLRHSQAQELPGDRGEPPLTNTDQGGRIGPPGPSSRRATKGGSHEAE